MAVSGVPSWIGSSAVNETGERWMSAARVKLRLAGAGWLSELAGRSNEILVNITGSNHNFDTGTLHSWMVSAAGGSWPANANWRIVVGSGVQLVAKDTGSQVMWFGGGINGKVIIENHGYILGRGGNGGPVTCADAGCAQGGGGGGHAIYREAKITLDIRNYGVISGGGGGGGAGYTFSSAGGGRHYGQGGGGGAPFGAAGHVSGPNHPRPGGGASWDGAGGGGAGGDRGEGHGGSGAGWAGVGGAAWGNNRANAGGGAAGYAIAGGGTIIWTNRGDLRGAVS